MFYKEFHLKSDDTTILGPRVPKDVIASKKAVSRDIVSLHPLCAYPRA